MPVYTLLELSVNLGVSLSSNTGVRHSLGTTGLLASLDEIDDDDDNDDDVDVDPRYREMGGRQLGTPSKRLILICPADIGLSSKRRGAQSSGMETSERENPPCLLPEPTLEEDVDNPVSSLRDGYKPESAGFVEGWEFEPKESPERGGKEMTGVVGTSMAQLVWDWRKSSSEAAQDVELLEQPCSVCESSLHTDTPRGSKMEGSPNWRLPNPSEVLAGILVLGWSQGI